VRKHVDRRGHRRREQQSHDHPDQHTAMEDATTDMAVTSFAVVVVV